MRMACKTRNTTAKKVMLQGQPTRSRIESIRLARDYAALSTPLECAGSEHVRGPVHFGVVALYGPTLKIRSYSQTHTLSLYRCHSCGALVSAPGRWIQSYE